MKHETIPRTLFILFLLVLATLGFSQKPSSFGFPRDTTYTLQSAYEKYKKDYPFIKPVEYNPSAGSLKKSVIYKSAGRPLILDIFSIVAESNPKPIVMLIHGGGWASGDRNLMYPLADFLAKHGLIAIAVEYRLSPEAQYPAAVRDLEDAVSWIFQNDKNYNIDTKRVAILGCSAGAQLAGLVGLTYGTNSNSSNGQQKIRAIINIDGIMDFTSEDARKHEDNPASKTTAAGRWFGGRYAEKPDLWREASPVHYVSKNSPPMLFINSSMPRFHAGRDEVIHKLDAFHIYSEVHTFDDAPHSFWLFDPWFEKTGTFIVEFLNNVLD